MTRSVDRVSVHSARPGKSDEEAPLPRAQQGPGRQLTPAGEHPSTTDLQPHTAAGNEQPTIARQGPRKESKPAGARATVLTPSAHTRAHSSYRPPERPPPFSLPQSAQWRTATYVSMSSRMPYSERLELPWLRGGPVFLRFHPPRTRSPRRAAERVPATVKAGRPWVGVYRRFTQYLSRSSTFTSQLTRGGGDYYRRAAYASHGGWSVSIARFSVLGRVACGCVCCVTISPGDFDSAPPTPPLCARGKPPN